MAWPGQNLKKIACYAKVHTHKRMYVTPYFVLPEKKNPFAKLETLEEVMMILLIICQLISQMKVS